MSVEFDRGSPGKFDTRTLSRETLSRWTGRNVFELNKDAISYYILLALDDPPVCRDPAKSGHTHERHDDPMDYAQSTY